MIDALGRPQSVLLLGGSSEIGLSAVERFVRDGATRVTLAGRPSAALDAAADRVRALGAALEVVDFDASRPDTHDEAVERAFAGGDVDVAVLAFGVLPDQSRAEEDPSLAVDAAQVNYVGAVSVGLHVARRLRAQGHGALVVVSSVAGERARRANFVYGSTKAGLDAFAQGLGDSLHGSGARVVVVRPGFVRTRMTQGLTPAPFSTTPGAVAAAIADALREGRETVWVPARLRLVMAVLRHLPRPLFRRVTA